LPSRRRTGPGGLHAAVGRALQIGTLAPKGAGDLRVLASIERRCLVWLAARLPSWISSDHLTVLALVAMLATGVSYYASRLNRIALLGAVLGLAANWFGDSLDGTLARIRGHQRPRYGFYVDHIVDCSVCCSSWQGWHCPVP
jgi:hypothetical protein